MDIQPASLFVGRWQPFHDGHKKLIETVLKKGKPVVIKASGKITSCQ